MDRESDRFRLKKIYPFLFSAPYYVVSVLLWPILWGGWAISIWLAYRWAQFSMQYLLSLSTMEFQGLVSGLLHTAELLLLIPLSGIVASVAFRNIRAFSDPNAQERDSAETEISVAKRLILGILVTVAGTRMLIEFLEGNQNWQVYLNGALLTLSVGAYSYLLALKQDRGR